MAEEVAGARIAGSGKRLLGFDEAFASQIKPRLLAWSIIVLMFSVPCV